MGKDASTIRQEIEETRERMGDTVEALGYKADVPARVKENVQQRVDAVKGTIGDVVDSVKESVGGISDSMSDARAQGGRNGADILSGARDTVRETAGKVNDRLSDGVNSLQGVDVAGKTQRAVGAVSENPIGLALVALSIGFLTGSLLPVLDIERERLQPIRAKIANQAQAVTSDLVEAGKAVAVETAQTVVASALSSAKSHGHEVADAAKARAAQS